MKLVKVLLKLLFFYLIIPIFLLLGTEVFLRYQGWGKDLSPWVEHTTEQGKVYTKNLDFYQQFFEHPVNPGEFEPYITAIRLPKPPNTIRIFVFGESAALGWPDAKYGFGEFLEVMLNRMYPQYRWEVFSVCFAGINSHILRYVARKSLFLQPDIVLIYMGNNEAHGTFGLLHDFKYSVPRPPWLVQLQIELQNLYLIQNLKRIDFFRTKPISPTQIRFDNPNIKKVQDYFEKNLKGIVDTFATRNIPVFIGTMASNLRDWPPKDSWFKENISNEQISLWNNLIDRGIENLISDNIEKAKKDFKEALSIDNSPALPYFLLGWCFIAEKNYEEARKNFVEAREKDGFGFVRSKQFINETIEKITREYGEARGVYLVPVEQELASYAFAGVPGNEMFIDSCHFNFYGAYLTACAYLKSIMNNVISTGLLKVSNSDVFAIPTYDEAKLLLGIPANENESLCKFMVNPNLSAVVNFPNNSYAKEMRNLLTIMHRRYLPNSLKKESVLTSIYDFSSMEYLIYHFDLLTDEQKPYTLIIKYLETLKILGAFRQGAEIIEKLLKDKGDDINYYYLAIDFYLNCKNYSQLEKLFQKFQQNYAFHDITEYKIKYAVLREDWDEAITLSNQVISNPFNSNTKKAFPRCVVIERNPALSSEAKFKQWKTILRESQWSWDSFNFVYQIAKRMGKVDKYEEILIEIVNDKPTSPFPYNFLAFVYEDKGEISKAVEMVRQAIFISSREVSNYYELSRLLTLEAKQLFDGGKIEEANRKLEEAVRNFPYYLPAWHMLIETCKAMGDEEGTLQKMYELEQIEEKSIMKHLWEIIY